jgi:hypothetical protein
LVAKIEPLTQLAHSPLAQVRGKGNFKRFKSRLWKVITPEPDGLERNCLQIWKARGKENDMQLSQTYDMNNMAYHLAASKI